MISSWLVESKSAFLRIWPSVFQPVLRMVLLQRATAQCHRLHITVSIPLQSYSLLYTAAAQYHVSASLSRTKTISHCILPLSFHLSGRVQTTRVLFAFDLDPGRSFCVDPGAKRLSEYGRAIHKDNSEYSGVKFRNQERDI